MKAGETTCRTCLVALLLALVIPQLRAGAAAAPADTIYSCNFSAGAAGWTSPDAVLSVETAANLPQANKQALALPLKFPGEATLSLKGPFQWRDAYSLQAVFFLQAAGLVQVEAYLVDDDLHWYQSTRLFEPVKNRLSTFRVDLSPASTEWAPVGHFKPWSRSVTQNVAEIGFRIFGKDKLETALYVADITVTRQAPPTVPLRILNYRTNMTEVPRFEKFEIAFALSREYENPFDPNQINVTGQFIAPNGEVTSVPGFYYQEYKRRLEDNREALIPLGGPEWKIRFAPTQPGNYSYTIKVDDGERPPTASAAAQTDKLVTAPRQFACIASKNHGFIRVSVKDPHYFEFDDGEFFYPIGHNIPATYNVKAHEMLGLTPLQFEGTFAYDRFLKGMGDNEENFARIWLAAWSFGLEWSPRYDIHYKGLGRYNLENAWRFDYVLDQARRKGIYLQLALTTFGHYRSEEFEGDWPFSPYNARNGGFLQNPWEFWSNAKAWDAYKQMLRYIAARWGYSTAIASWEVCNEINLVTNFTQFHQDIVRWHERCGEWMRQLDQGRHMITTNFSDWTIDPEILSLPVISYSSTNRYDLNAVSALTEVRSMKAQLGKPVLMVECGADFQGSTPATTQRYIPIYLWSAYMMPFAGAGMQWWWDFIEDQNLYYYFKALAEYARGEDRRGQDLKNAPAALRKTGSNEPVEGLASLCLKNDHTAYLWIYDKALFANELKRELPERDGVDVVVSELAAGLYRAESWDTTKGVIISTQEVETKDGTVCFTLPGFRGNIAAKIKPAAGKEK